MRDLAKKFAMEVMRPIGIELDKLPLPEMVADRESDMWEVHRKYREMGFHIMNFPKTMGGMQGEIEPITGTLISEELGYGDAGLSISLGVSNFPFAMALMSGDKELRDLAGAYAEDKKAELVGCWAITEPDHGSDWIMSVLPEGNSPEMAPTVKAKLVGDEYILNGMKAAWVSNGTIATHATLHVSLEPENGMHGTGLALCPLDLPGISRSKPLDKMGQRPLNQGEIIFQDVKLPKKWMFINNSKMMVTMLKNILTGANTGMSINFAALARAAYDEALKYSHERIQGGGPIFQHQNIQLKLFKMFRMVETARSYARVAAAYNGGAMGMGGGSAKHAVAAKILSTETAFEVTSEAIQVFGGNGLAKEYPVEKMFRDARASMIEDGVNESLALAVAPDL